MSKKESNYLKNIFRRGVDITRRLFIKRLSAGLLSTIPLASIYKLLLLDDQPGEYPGAASDIFWIKDIPSDPFPEQGNSNYHEGVEALLHISEIDKNPEEKIEDIFQPGAELTTCIINVDADNRKIGLSTKTMVD